MSRVVVRPRLWSGAEEVAQRALQPLAVQVVGVELDQQRPQLADRPANLAARLVVLRRRRA